MRSALIWASRAPVQTGICRSCCSSLPAALPNSSSGARGQCCSFPAAISNAAPGKRPPSSSGRWGGAGGQRWLWALGAGWKWRMWGRPRSSRRLDSESLIGLCTLGFDRTNGEVGKGALGALGRDHSLGSCLGSEEPWRLPATRSKQDFQVATSTHGSQSSFDEH